MNKMKLTPFLVLLVFVPLMFVVQKPMMFAVVIEGGGGGGETSYTWFRGRITSAQTGAGIPSATVKIMYGSSTLKTVTTASDGWYSALFIKTYSSVKMIVSHSDYYSYSTYRKGYYDQIINVQLDCVTPEPTGLSWTEVSDQASNTGEVYLGWIVNTDSYADEGYIKAYDRYGTHFATFSIDVVDLVRKMTFVDVGYTTGYLEFELFLRNNAGNGACSDYVSTGREDTLCTNDPLSTWLGGKFYAEDTYSSPTIGDASLTLMFDTELVTIDGQNYAQIHVTSMFMGDLETALGLSYRGLYLEAWICGGSGELEIEDAYASAMNYDNSNLEVEDTFFDTYFLHPILKIAGPISWAGLFYHSIHGGAHLLGFEGGLLLGGFGISGGCILLAELGLHALTSGIETYVDHNIEENECSGSSGCIRNIAHTKSTHASNFAIQMISSYTFLVKPTSGSMTLNIVAKSPELSMNGYRVIGSELVASKLFSFGF